MHTGEQTVATISVMVTGSMSNQITPFIKVTHYGMQEDSRNCLGIKIIKLNHLAVRHDILRMIYADGILEGVENLLMMKLMLLVYKYHHPRMKGNIENRNMMFKLQS